MARATGGRHRARAISCAAVLFGVASCGTEPDSDADSRDSCATVGVGTLDVDDSVVPFDAQRGRTSESTILDLYDSLPETERDRPRTLRLLTERGFEDRHLALGFSAGRGTGREEYEYYLDRAIFEDETYASFLRDGGILVTAARTPREPDLVSAPPDVAELEASMLPVRVGPYRGLLNLADPVDGVGTRPFLLTWQAERERIVMHAVADDPAELVNRARALVCQ